MEISALAGMLDEAVNKFYKNQKFFKGIKNYPSETQKTIVEYFRKKGVSYPRGTNRYRSDPLDYKQETGQYTSEEKKIMKSYGFKEAEIKQLPKTDVSKFVEAVRRVAPYTVRGNDPKDYKAWLDGMSKNERDKTVKNIINNTKEYKAQKHRELVGSFDVDSDFFSASSGGYRNDLEFPVMKIEDGNDFQIVLKTNETFFEDGHDLHITVFEKNDDEYNRDRKTYKYKIDLMEPIPEVLDEIWEMTQKSIKRYEKGEDSDPDKKDNQQKRSSTKNEQVAMIEGYFSKWYGTTKTGKLRELSIDRMPAEVYVSQSGGGKRMSTHKESMPDIIFNYKLRGNKLNPKTIEKKIPGIRDWHRIYTDASRNISGRWGVPDLERMFGDRLFTKEHDKFFTRLKFIARKLVADGYIPTGNRNAHKRGDFNSITFKYSPKIHEAYRENPEETIQRVLDSQKFEKNVNEAWNSKGTKIEDIPKTYIKRILELEPRS